LDVTIIRLLDGTRAYLHAVIDNYSRRILSWVIEDRLGSGGTCAILREAASQLNRLGLATKVMADSGSENLNDDVDELLRDEKLTRVLAQVEVTFSNSMIEAFFRSLKHSWLYLNPAHRGIKRGFRYRATQHAGKESEFIHDFGARG